MTYEELLLDNLWQSKRRDIIQQANKECQLCRNRQIIDRSEIGKLIELTCEDDELLAMLNASDPRFRPEKPKYKLRFLPQSPGLELTTNIYLFGWCDKELLNKLVHCPVYYSYEQEENHETGNLNKHLVINLIENNQITNEKWFYASNLHVHHIYYQQGKLPWEYPDTALQTLCWLCHQELHKNREIPILNEQGVDIGKLTYCLRCSGSGYFPQYSHIQNGICFRCRGARYEECFAGS